MSASLCFAKAINLITRFTERNINLPALKLAFFNKLVPKFNLLGEAFNFKLLKVIFLKTEF